MTARVVKTTLKIVGFAALAITLTAIAADLVVTERNAGTFYRDFTRLTGRPHAVDPLTAFACTIPSQAREKQITGPHYKAYVHLYANPAAMPAVTNRLAAFPIGSVIVKEKLADRGRVSGVGGMIKRAPGYDAANGDWEYFYYGKPGEFSSGRIKSCIGVPPRRKDQRLCLQCVEFIGLLTA